MVPNVVPNEEPMPIKLCRTYNLDPKPYKYSVELCRQYTLNHKPVAYSSKFCRKYTLNPIYIYTHTYSMKRCRNHTALLSGVIKGHTRSLDYSSYSQSLNDKYQYHLNPKAVLLYGRFPEWGDPNIDPKMLLP